MSKIKSFFKITKYELIRITRNKFVLSMLLGFSILLLIILSLVNVGAKDLPVGIYTGGLELNEIGVLDVIEEEFNRENLILVDSQEEGVKKVNSGEFCFFISINRDTSPITATFYYDASSSVGRTIKNSIDEIKNRYAYETTNNFLKNYGIKLNEAYFDVVSFEKSNGSTVTMKQMPFALEVGCCLSIVIMFGLAYSISRDNETQVTKNLSYIPMGINRYLLSKVLPYVLIAVAEIYVLLVIGGVAFKIDYQADILLIVLCSTLFIIATSMLGLLFSLSKSQLSTVFLDMVAIILPMFVLTMAYVQGFPLILQLILYAFPISTFVSFLNSLMYSGIIVWWKLGVFAVQIALYYMISLFILKRRVKGKVL